VGILHPTNFTALKSAPDQEFVRPIRLIPT
jgi:hypothetical protein